MYQTITVTNSIIIDTDIKPHAPPYHADASTTINSSSDGSFVGFELVCFQKLKTRINASFQKTECNDASFDYASPAMSSVDKTSIICKGIKASGYSSIGNIFNEITKFEAKICLKHQDLMTGGIECKYEFEIHEDYLSDLPVLDSILNNHIFECVPAGGQHEATDHVNS